MSFQSNCQNVALQLCLGPFPGLFLAQLGQIRSCHPCSRACSPVPACCPGPNLPATLLNWCRRGLRGIPEPAVNCSGVACRCVLHCAVNWYRLHIFPLLFDSSSHIQAQPRIPLLLVPTANIVIPPRRLVPDCASSCASSPCHAFLNSASTVLTVLHSQDWIWI